jgi:hypothetical protein
MCKFWLKPDVSLAENDGFADYELNVIAKIVHSKQPIFISQYEAVHASKNR